jgi:hypothetical protein
MHKAQEAHRRAMEQEERQRQAERETMERKRRERERRSAANARLHSQASSRGFVSTRESLSGPRCVATPSAWSTSASMTSRGLRSRTLCRDITEERVLEFVPSGAARAHPGSRRRTGQILPLGNAAPASRQIRREGAW